jgi:hypothetical protein
METMDHDNKVINNRYAVLFYFLFMLVAEIYKDISWLLESPVGPVYNSRNVGIGLKTLIKIYGILQGQSDTRRSG